MSDTLGTIKGQLVLDVKQALNAYTTARQAHISTVTALQTGAGAAIGAGVVLAGVGTAIAGGFLAAVNAAAQFDKTMAFAAAISDYTADQLKAVKAEAIDLGNKTVYSNQQVADSFVELAKAGVSAEDIVNGVGQAVVYLGAASDLPLDTAANIMTAALATFGLGADHAVDVANKLQGAANASTIDVQDLGTSLKYAGGTAAALGVPFDQLNVTLAELGKAGIRGSTAGTSLRQILVSLGGSSDKAKESLRQLGIITADGTNRFFDAQGALKPLPQVFDILKQSVAGLNKEQQLSALRSIFQQRSLSSVFTLLNGGSELYNQFADAIGNTTAIDIANKRLDNLSGSIEILKGNFESAQVVIGENFQGIATMVVRAVTAMLQAFVALPGPVQVVLTALSGFMGLLLILVGVGGIFAGSVLNIIALYLRLKDAAIVLTGITNALSRAQAALNFIMAANPFAKVIAIIGILVAAFAILYNTNKQFHDAVQSLFAQLGPLIQQVVPFVQGLLNAFVGFAQQGLGAVVGVLPTVLGFLSQLVSVLGGALGSVLSAVLPPILQLVGILVAGFMPVLQAIIPLISTVGQIISAAFGGNIAALPGLISTFIQQFTAVIGAIATSLIPAIIQVITQVLVALIGILPAVITAGIQLFTGLVTAVSQVLPQIVGAISTLVGQLIATLIGMIPTLITTFIGLITGIISALTTLLPVLIQAGIQLFTGLITAVVTIIPQLITAVVQLIPVLIQAIVSLIPLLITAAIQLFLGLLTGLLQALPQLITAVVNGLVQILTAIVNAIPQLIQAAIQLFLGLLIGLVQAIPQVIVALVNAIPQIITALVSALPQLISGAIQLFLGILTGLISAIPQIIDALIKAGPQIVNALIAAGPQFVDAGKQLIKGLINGFGAMGGALLDAVKKLANSAIDGFKKLFGIHSPSTVFAAMGINLVQGLVNGIRGMQRQAVQSVTALANAVNGVPLTLAPLTGSVSAASDLQSQLANAQSAAAQIGVESATTISLENLRDVIDEIQPNVTNIDVDVHNPVAEPASASLPGAIRQAVFIAGD